MRLGPGNEALIEKIVAKARDARKSYRLVTDQQIFDHDIKSLFSDAHKRDEELMGHVFEIISGSRKPTVKGEIAVEIPGFPGYQVVNGAIYKKGRPITVRTSGRGYPSVQVWNAEGHRRDMAVQVLLIAAGVAGGVVREDFWRRPVTALEQAAILGTLKVHHGNYVGGEWVAAIPMNG